MVTNKFVHFLIFPRNNVCIIDGGRELTLLSTCIYLDEDEKAIISAINQRLKSADYAIIGSQAHD